jgi:hypothetical protein
MQTSPEIQLNDEHHTKRCFAASNKSHNPLEQLENTIVTSSKASSKRWMHLSSKRGTAPP